MLSLPRRKYPAMLEPKDVDAADELIASLHRLHHQPGEQITLEILRLLADIPGSAVTDLACRLPDRFRWLLLYHPQTAHADIVRALQALPYQDLSARHIITARITPVHIQDLTPSVRPVILGRLMLAVLNHQLPLSALPDHACLLDYVDEFVAVGGPRRRHAELWDALYTLVRAIDLWRRSGFHPRQWECQTVICSLPSQEPDALLQYAHDMRKWAGEDRDRMRFAGAFWGLTLKYLGAGESPHLCLADLCSVMEAAAALQPPFLAEVQPDPEALEYVTVDDFDQLFRTVML